MPKPKILGGKADQSGTSQKYIRELDHGVESEQAADRITLGTAAPSESRLAINYILGGPDD